jgi:ABC-type phosphate/phosphonate transport system substrate-binding protein
MKEPSRRVSVALYVAAFLLATVVRAEAQTKQKASTKPLALGVVFQGPREPLEEHFRPLVEYAARKLTPTTETQGMVVVAPTAAQMMKLLEEKRVDFYMESPYPS